MDYQFENTRYCLRKGHEENRASYISIYKRGQQTQQWLCVDCILQYFDNDGQPTKNHNMRKNLFLDFIKQQSQPIHYQNKESKKQIQICIKRLQQFIQSTYLLIQQLQEEMKIILEIEEIIKLTQKDHNLLINEQIDKLINLNNFNKKFDYSLSSDLLKQVIQDFVDLQNQLYNKDKNNYKEQNIILINQELDNQKKQIDDGDQIQVVDKKTINQKNYTKDFIDKVKQNILKSPEDFVDLQNQQYNINKNNQQLNTILINQQLNNFEKSVDDGDQIQGDYKKTIKQKNDTDYFNNKSKQNIVKSPEIKNRKYVIQDIDQTNGNFNGSSISKNEKYLAYGGGNQLLKIYDMKLKKIIKEIKLDNDLSVCQFTQDSSQLYIGLDGGYACRYDVQDDFKETYKQQIHPHNIFNIITIQNEYLITCSYHSIIKTNIKDNQQMFKLTGHTDWIFAIDYNDKDQIIVSGSYDKSIKLWNCRNQSIIIDREHAHNDKIKQIQLINNNLNILSLDVHGNLYKWKIDLTNKDLIYLQQFCDLNDIFNFYQVNQDKNLLLICNNYTKILNQQGETMNTIEHGGKGKNDRYYECRQLDNMNYIQIRTRNQIILVIGQD